MKLRNMIAVVLLLLGACRPEPSMRGNTYILRGSSPEISLVFDAHENRYYGQVVNRYFGIYRSDESGIVFGQPSSTMYSGDEEDLIAEETYLSDLVLVQKYTLDENTLTLYAPNRNPLVFDRR